MRKPGKTTYHRAQLKELQEREKLLKLQEEQSCAIEKSKQQTKQADRLEKWNEGDQADAYLAKFETITRSRLNNVLLIV